MSVVKGSTHQTHSEQGRDSQLKHKMRRENKVPSHLQARLPFFFSPHTLKTTPGYDTLASVYRKSRVCFTFPQPAMWN